MPYVRLLVLNFAQKKGMGQGAMRVAEQAVGNLLERNEEVMALGTYMGQCMQSLQWQALQREMDYGLA